MKEWMMDLDELTLWAKAAPDSGVLLHVSDALALIAAARENTRLRAELSAACGYLLNAKINLETGAPPFPPTETIMDDQRKVRIGTYMTRSGKLAVITSRIDSRPKFPFRGHMLGGPHIEMHWSEDGRYSADGAPDPFDLVLHTLNDIETLELENARLQSRLDAIEGRMAEAREAVRLADIVLPVKSDADGSVDGTCVPADSWCAAAIIAALNLLHEEETDG